MATSTAILWWMAFVSREEAVFPVRLGRLATILRKGGFRVMIFANDHAPPHVHVFKGEAEAIIELRPVNIRENYRMSKANLRKAVNLVAENQGRLLHAWSEMHGDE